MKGLEIEGITSEGRYPECPWGRIIPRNCPLGGERSRLEIIPQNRNSQSVSDRRVRSRDRGFVFLIGNNPHWQAIVIANRA